MYGAKETLRGPNIVGEFEESVAKGPNPAVPGHICAYLTVQGLIEKNFRGGYKS